MTDDSLDLTAAERLTRIERRMARIEAHLGITDSPVEVAPMSVVASLPPVMEPEPAAVGGDLEYELGQDWFAAAGIITLTLGVFFMLALPYAGLPAALPAILGYVAVAVLFGLAQVGRKSFVQAAGYLQAAGLALLYWATLRLFFFGDHPALDPHGVLGATVLAAASVFNLGYAWWRRSLGLMVLALVTACMTPVVVNGGGFMAVAIMGLAVAVVGASRRLECPGLVLAGIGLVGATYFLWAIGNPVLGGAYHWATEPALAPGCLFAAMLVFGLAPLARPLAASGEEAVTYVGAGLTCALGYGLFLLHTAAAFPAGFVAAHAGVSVLMLAVAVTFWVRRQSQVVTFFYAMTGYAALTMAIIKADGVPEVFVWLSLQSLVVVATAIWFRSRFIIVANFLIYLAIVGGYMVMNEHESGISLGIGIVALVSARILNWQQDRLELKTGLMRNAYLLSAFLVFPYAMHHLVAGRWVALSWVGLAVVYYALSLSMENQKYRWMGHGTLFLSAGFVVFAGSIEPVYRVLSFLALGTVLLVVSLVFKRLSKRGRVVEVER